MYHFFSRIKPDILVNIHTNFYRKRMRITIKISIFKNATFNIVRPLLNRHHYLYNRISPTWNA